MTIVRSYRSSDWPRICDIHNAARLDELRLTTGVDAYLSLQEAVGNEKLFDYTLYVAEHAGSVQGFVAYCDQELAWLYVDPACYRQGVGRALVQHVVENAPGPTLEVEMLEGNEPALTLYLSEGFEVSKRIVGKLAGNEGFAATGLILQRSISPAPH